MPRERVGPDDFFDVPSDPEPENGRVFLDAYDFVEVESEPPVPLLGNEQVCVVPAGGLVLLAGRPSTGKTTLALDLGCHLAAGLPWPPSGEGDRAPDPWPTPRPLRVALVENEGPIEMFRSKLKEKLARFPHDIRKRGGKLTVASFRWGSFSFADPDIAKAATRELEEDGIDLVIGDPLATLGPEGVGSPAETFAFVQQLRPLGLGTTRAFLFLHHFRERVERTEDEMRRLSGAWSGHLDTLLTLSSTGSADQARLAYPKLRWSRVREPSPIILGRVWNTSTFEAIGEEGDVSILEPLIYAHLSEARSKGGGAKGRGYFTVKEIQDALDRRQQDVRNALEGAPHLFDLATGARAKTLGRRPTTKLWGLTEWEEEPDPTGPRPNLTIVPDPLDDDEPDD